MTVPKFTLFPEIVAPSTKEMVGTILSATADNCPDKLLIFLIPERVTAPLSPLQEASRTTSVIFESVIFVPRVNVFSCELSASPK